MHHITRLIPLGEVLARIDALVSALAPGEVEVGRALGDVLAADVVASADAPAMPRALREGWAVRADDLAEASSHAALPLVEKPVWVDAGDPLPPGTDAVAPRDSMIVQAGRLHALAQIAPGESVIARGADLPARDTLLRAGARLCARDIAVLQTAGIAHVSTRAPRLLVTSVHDDDPMLAPVRNFIGTEAALVAADMEADFSIRLGGHGGGHDDPAVAKLAREGRIEAYGIALAPGETAAFGIARDRPALVLPSRLDSALAVWLVIGRLVLARLSGAAAPRTVRARLKRKVVSSLGLAEVVPVRLQDGIAEPLAGATWPLVTIAHADGWLLVPPDSEGYAAAAEVMIRPWI